MGGTQLSLSPPAVLLACAHVLIKAGWCKGARAVDEYGVPCSPLGLRAVRWDLEGALQRAAYCILAVPASGNIHREPAYCQALAALETAVGARPRRRLARGALADYNDDPQRSLAEVLALLEAVIRSFEPPEK